MGADQSNDSGLDMSTGFSAMGKVMGKMNALNKLYERAKKVADEVKDIAEDAGKTISDEGGAEPAVGMSEMMKMIGMTGGTCCSGASPTSGGYNALVDYGNSVYSQTKEKLIRGIAADISSALKVDSKFANSSPIGKVVEKLQKIVRILATENIL